MNRFAERLDNAIAAVCPIHGVSVGRKTDKASWRIDFKDEATDAQKADAQKVMAAIDIATLMIEPDPLPTLEDVIASLPQASKDAIAATVAARSAGALTLGAAQPVKAL